MFAVITNKEVKHVFINLSTQPDDIDAADVWPIDDSMSERRLAAVYNFCTGLSLQRIKNKDMVIAAVKTYLIDKKAPARDVIADKIFKKPALPSVVRPGDRKHKGVKQRLRELLIELSAPGPDGDPSGITLENACLTLNTHESNIRTAVSDLKSSKYAGSEGPLDIKKDATKGYHL